MSADEQQQDRQQESPDIGIIGVAQFKDEIGRVKQDSLKVTRQLEDLNRRVELSLRGNVLLKSYDERPSSKRRGRKPGSGLSEKEFVMQNSVLTDLLESKHMQSVQNGVLAVVLFWFTASAVSDFYQGQSLRAVLPSIDLIEHSFYNGQIAISMWLKLQIVTLAIFPLARFWANERPKRVYVTWFDRLFLLGYFVYQAIFILIPCHVLFIEPILGVASTLFLTMEQVRLMMKMHSFVREVARQCFKAEIALLSKKTDGEKPSSPASSWNFPKFRQYVYFLFAPTLIYRDSYPRNPAINWDFVFTNFAGFAASLLYTYYLIDRYLLPELKVFNPKTASFEIYLKAWIRCAIPGMGIQLMSFFGFFHSWLNVWAELLRFGDRVFYRDWWTLTEYASYWRQWNCVVHDWLHTYIYKEFHDSLKICKSFKAIAAFFVFFVSSVFHEYIMTAMLGFFFPLMTCYLSGVGFIITLFDMKNGGRFANVFMWWGTFMFLGLQFSLYVFETSARKICPPVYDNYFLNGAPRFWLCWGRTDL